MTDGTPASIAIKSVKVREVNEPANMTWLRTALHNYLGGELSTISLLQTFPGATSPLLWWTTTNMQFVSASLLEAGLETTFVMLMRQAFQRSFATSAERCVQNVLIPTQLTAHITTFGFTFGIVFVIGLLIVNLVCFLAALPWVISTHPIHPAIRLASEHTYFSFMAVSHLTQSVVQGVSSANNVMEVWPKLDFSVRVGESIHTKEDPEYGKISIDKPKMVTNFVKGKQYC